MQLFLIKERFELIKHFKRIEKFCLLGKNIVFFIYPTREVQQCNIYFILTIHFKDLTFSADLKNKIVKNSNTAC